MALTDGLVAYYKLDGNSNDVFGNNGSDTNITYNSGNGKLVQGAGFNNLATSDILIGNSAIFNLSNITISAWFKTTTTTNQVIVGKSHTTSYYLNAAAAANQIAFWTNGSSTNSQSHGTPVLNIADGNWHHIVATLNGSISTIYWDGSQNAQRSGATSGTDSTNLYIGSSTSNPIKFQGSIDEVGIWNRGLSADEVKDLYLNGSGSQYPFRDKMFF